MAQASTIQRAAARQAFALALVGGVAAGVVVAPIREPEPITTLVVVLAILGAFVAAVVVAAERGRVLRQADTLIEQGFDFGGRADATSRFVAKRVEYLESCEHRLALVRLCQQHLDLAQTRDEPMGYPQPYVSITTLRQNAGVLRRIIASLEEGPCDPRLALLLERTMLYNSPTPFCGTFESWRQAQEHYSTTLREVLAMMDGADATRRTSAANGLEAEYQPVNADDRCSDGDDDEG